MFSYDSVLEKKRNPEADSVCKKYLVHMLTGLFILVSISLLHVALLGDNSINNSMNKNIDKAHDYYSCVEPFTNFKNVTKRAIMIRHCEKVKNKDTGLSLEGTTHSLCLVDYFKSFPFGQPQMIFTEISKTYRSIATALPMFVDFCKYMTRFTENDANIVEKIYRSFYEHDVILIIAEHHFIPYLARELGCVVCENWNLDPTANAIDNDLYNMTWMFEFKIKPDNRYHIDKFYIAKQNYIRDDAMGYEECIKNYTYDVKRIY